MDPREPSSALPFRRKRDARLVVAFTPRDPAMSTTPAQGATAPLQWEALLVDLPGGPLAWTERHPERACIEPNPSSQQTARAKPFENEYPPRDRPRYCSCSMHRRSRIRAERSSMFATFFKRLPFPAQRLLILHGGRWCWPRCSAEM